MSTTEIQTITVDGKEYDLATLSPDIHKAIGVYQIYEQELIKEQQAVLKTQFAIKALSTDISNAVKESATPLGEAKAPE